MKYGFIIISVLLIAGVLYQANEGFLRPKKNVRTILVPRDLFSDLPEEGARVAVLGDIHVKQSLKAYEELSNLLDIVLASKPELILLLGDYTATPSSVSDMNTHRSEIAERLSVLTSVPLAAIMGNYETWSGLTEWKRPRATVLRAMRGRRWLPRSPWWTGR